MNMSSQRLGKTRSGKIIAQPIHMDTHALNEIAFNFTQSDQFDAYALFQYLISREFRRQGRYSPSVEIYKVQARFHGDKLTNHQRFAEMEALLLTTIFDVVRFGKSRADGIFQD